MDYLLIIMPVLAAAGMIAAGLLSYRRGRMRGLREQPQTENKSKLESLRQDIVSRDRQIRSLQSQVQSLGESAKPQIKRIESLENKLRQKAREISLLSEASLFLSTIGLQETYDLVAQRVGVLPYVKFSRLYILNDEVTILRLVSGHNISEKYIEMIRNEFEFSVNNIPAGMAVRNSAPFVVDDVRRDDYFAQWREVAAMYDYRSYIAVPLLRPHRILGVVEIFLEKENVLTKDTLEIINIIANIGALAIENCLFTGELQELSVTDKMTSVYNHRFLIDTFGKEVERAARHQHAISYIMIDLDNFKTINDTLGHLKGDEVLMSVAKILKDTVRSTDYVCRYGGDEFGILLLETDREATIKVIEKLRSAAVPLWDSLPSGSNMSIGFAVYPEDGRSPADLIKHADSLIYQEKQAKQAR